MAKKDKTIFVCQSCGNESAKWLGKCPDCEAWSSFVEEIRSVKKVQATRRSGYTEPVSLLEGNPDELKRLDSGIDELDRVLGGGIVSGSLVMIGGDPGIGKSTLMLQMLDKISNEKKLLYISGEESLQQIQLRAKRLGIKKNNILFSKETELQPLLTMIGDKKPDIAIIDSIQTLYNSEIESIPGNVSQLRSCAAELQRVAKHDNIPVFLVGHVTKEGALAGPRVLEHIVDTVLYFEGDSQYDYRILRSTKNRFGPVNEIGLFRMGQDGLQSVTNPSEVFLDLGNTQQSGTAVTAILEGNRVFLVQVQALVTRTQFGTPQRTATGIGHRRMNLLLAVLEKRCGKLFGFHDVFIKTAGGLEVDDPAADLAVCMALVSSIDDLALPAQTLYIGEVGLGGEIRNVNRIEERIHEAEKLGIKNIVAPKAAASLKNRVTAQVKISDSVQNLIR